MRKIFCLLILLAFSGNTFSQPADSVVKPKVKTKRYHVNYYVTGSIIAVGMASDYFAIGRLKSKPKLTSEELAFANTDQQKNLINSIDRWALHQKSSDRTLYKKISDYGEIGIFILPGLLIIDKEIRKDWLDLLLMYVEGHTVTFSFYNYSPLGPTFVNRFRPFVYYPQNGTEGFTDDYRMNNNNTRNAFFSGHVGSCAYSTFFMAKVYCDYHPDLGAAKYLLYLAASIPPLAIGYARIKSLDHFPSDVAVGFGLGAVIGIVVPALHKLSCSKYLSVGLSTSPEEVGLSVRWKLDRKRLAR
ncbi:MAG: phosphatase PAP2 family protein [Bacteroidetes bacterium]|nr:phosphatase PAP2 family protein [Bacteroidota bacterium]